MEENTTDAATEPGPVKPELPRRPFRKPLLVLAIPTLLVCPLIPFALWLVTQHTILTQGMSVSMQTAIAYSGLATAIVGWGLGIPLYLFLIRLRSLHFGIFFFWGAAIALLSSVPMMTALPIAVAMGLLMSTVLWLALVKLRNPAKG